MQQPISILNEEYSKYITRGIIVDTELLILLLVGQYDSKFVDKFKITNKYGEKDYLLLAGFLNKFKKIIITPHILSEVSNHIDKVPSGQLKGCIEKMIETILAFDESTPSKNDILSEKNIRRFGVADISITTSSKQGDFLIITKDWNFANFCRNEELLPVITFDEVRSYDLFNSSA